MTDDPKPLTIAPDIQADILTEARGHAEEIEAYVSEQLRDEMGRHDFDAPDEAESGLVFTFGHYRKLGRIVSLLRDLSLSPPFTDGNCAQVEAITPPPALPAEVEEIAALITNPDCGLNLYRRGAYALKSAEYWKENMRKAKAVMKYLAYRMVVARTPGTVEVCERHANGHDCSGVMEEETGRVATRCAFYLCPIRASAPKHTTATSTYPEWKRPCPM